MFLPIRDENQAVLKPPYVTIFLIALNALVFFLCVITLRLEEVNSLYGLNTARFLKGENFSLITLFTYMFLHGDFFHLGFNMWVLWLFGDNVEHHLGRIRFLFFYLFAGVVSGLLFVITETPMSYVIGASGAISGVAGAYLILFPKNKIKAMWFPLPIFSNIPAFIYIGINFLINAISLKSQEPVAYVAHIGGYVGGILLLILIKRKVEKKDYEEVAVVNI